MAIKDNIDFSTFTDSKSSKDLFSNSIRKAFTYDSYGDRTTFQAVVISDPIPVSPKDLEFFTGEPGFVGKAINTINNTTTQFTYRARIIGTNSPHSFLPDPCDPAYSSEPEESFKIIAMHTLFVSNEEGGSVNSLPRFGSVVEVELKKNVFGYDLQYGKHIKLVSNPETNKEAAEACDTLEASMARASGQPISSYAFGEESGGPPLDDPKVQEIYDEYVKRYGLELAPPDGMCGNLPDYPLEKCKTGTIGSVTVTLHPKFFDKVKEKYDLVKAQNFNETFDGGSSIRVLKKQISLRINNSQAAGNQLSLDEMIGGSSGLCDPPTAPLPTSPGKGSRHIYGCAIDFGGILQEEGVKAAKLSNSIARRSKTYKFLLSLQEPGFKNYSAEPWHWSVDGR